MDDLELAELLADLESDRVERKASTSDGKKIRQAICAFANDLPNHNLAEAMKNLGYVQRFGIGIPIAQKELKKNGNPEAEFDINDSYISVIIRR